MTPDLIESHQEDSNGGDADHNGEALEACSYCRDMAYARGVLTASGVDVTPLRPEVYCIAALSGECYRAAGRGHESHASSTAVLHKGDEPWGLCSPS